MKKKILTVIGARPQFIKCYPVTLQLSKYFKEYIVHTGQHYDDKMSDNFFREMNIPVPDYNLNVGSGTHSEQTALIMLRLEKLVNRIKPVFVIVYGDTNSTLAASLTAAKMNIDIVHIEAGLRSFNRIMPEEINRICTDNLSEILFCPTNLAVENLKSEGIVKNVYMTGDVMKDALLLFQKRIKMKNIFNKYNINRKSEYIFMTLHRQENTEDKKRFRKIFEMAKSVNNTVIFPAHPRTVKKISKYKLRIPQNIVLTHPLGYTESICFQKYAKFVITDSGGIQKESCILNTPCITLRNETEWQETVDLGMNKVVGVSKNKFKKAINDFKQKKVINKTGDLYGNGDASFKIARILDEIYA